MTTQAISEDEVLAVLQECLSSRRGDTGRIVSLRQRACDYASTYSVAELEATLEDGRTLALVFKDLASHAMIASATSVKPAFVLAPRRELDVYRDLLPALEVAAARCYGAHADETRGRHWLFLEHVRGWHLWESDFAAFVAAARWLAGFHARAAAHQGSLPASLARHDEAYYHTWARRAGEFVRGKVEADRYAALQRLVAAYEQVARRLAALPRHFIHGEFYPSNVLVREAGGICPIDWEMAATGSGLMDLAALTSGRWSPEERLSLEAAYRGELRAKGADWTDACFGEALALCRLQVAVQWLGWSPQWTPPSMHAQDWLGEALSLGTEVLQ